MIQPRQFGLPVQSSPKMPRPSLVPACCQAAGRSRVDCAVGSDKEAVDQGRWQAISGRCARYLPGTSNDPPGVVVVGRGSNSDAVALCSDIKRSIGAKC